MTRRSLWLVVPVIVLLVVGGVLAWDRFVAHDRDTVSVLLQLGRDGTGQATIWTRRGRVADPGPFAERMTALVVPTARRLGVRGIYTDLAHRYDMVDVSLTEIPAPLRLDTQALQRALAAAGFQRLVVGLYSEEHWQVAPHSASRAGGCFGNGLSCEWRLATGKPPLKVEVRPA